MAHFTTGLIKNALPEVRIGFTVSDQRVWMRSGSGGGATVSCSTQCDKQMIPNHATANYNSLILSREHGLTWRSEARSVSRTGAFKEPHLVEVRHGRVR